MTPRQAEYVSFMRQFFIENDQLPPVAVTAAAIGVRVNAAHEVMHRLERAGVIERNAVQKWRWKR